MKRGARDLRQPLVQGEQVVFGKMIIALTGVAAICLTVLTTASAGGSGYYGYPYRHGSAPGPTVSPLSTQLLQCWWVPIGSGACLDTLRPALASLRSSRGV
jgi:hypothetical protein